MSPAGFVSGLDAAHENMTYNTALDKVPRCTVTTTRKPSLCSPSPYSLPQVVNVTPRYAKLRDSGNQVFG